jgi:hypothetical protein
MIVQRKILFLQEWRKTPTDSPTITVANVECRKAERQEVFRVWLSAIGWTATAVFWKFVLLQRGGSAGRIQAAAAAL